MNNEINEAILEALKGIIKIQNKEINFSVNNTSNKRYPWSKKLDKQTIITIIINE